VTKHPKTVAKILSPVNLIFALAALTTFGLMLRGSFEKYIYRLSEFYDVGNYLAIAQNGYTDKGISAFYPLWPLVIAFFARVFGLTDTSSLGLLAGILSTVIFIVSIFILYKSLEKIAGAVYGSFALGLFVLNPTSIFHLIGFSESLCTLLFALLLREFLGLKRIWVYFALTLLLSFVRPIVYFIPLSAVLAWLLANLYTKKLSDGLSKSLTLASAALVGYIVIGAYFHQHLGDFFSPARAQEIWGRRFGFHFELLFAPSSVGGSGQVLFWDLLAFYVPIGLFIFSAWQKFFNRDSASRFHLITSDPIYWFFLLMSCANSAAAFLTYPIFASTSRHLFAIPCIFYCLARLLQAFEVKVEYLWVSLAICATFYVRWWARFGKGSWIG
jgi:hypothetical protein